MKEAQEVMVLLPCLVGVLAIASGWPTVWVGCHIVKGLRHET